MAKNYVCNGAVLECTLCTKPEGKLVVTSNQVKVQDKLFANAKDKAKTNLVFEGNCKKSRYQASPCASVIQPQDWQGVADLIVQDAPALLEDSTIMCAYGGASIKITDHLQTNTPGELQPVAAPVIDPIEDPMFTHFEWQDTEETAIKKNGIYAEHVVFIQTQNILPGERLTVYLKEKDKEVVRDNEEKVRYTGTVDSKGMLKLYTQNTAVPKIENTKENHPKIEEMYWVDIEGNKVDSANENERINLYIKVTNIEEGEELSIGIDNEEGKCVTYIGVVDAAGNTVLKS